VHCRSKGEVIVWFTDLIYMFGLSRIFAQACGMWVSLQLKTIGLLVHQATGRSGLWWLICRYDDCNFSIIATSAGRTVMLQTAVKPHQAVEGYYACQTTCWAPVSAYFHIYEFSLSSSASKKLLTECQTPSDKNGHARLCVRWSWTLTHLTCQLSCRWRLLWCRSRLYAIVTFHFCLVLCLVIVRVCVCSDSELNSIFTIAYIHSPFLRATI